MRWWRGGGESDEPSIEYASLVVSPEPQYLVNAHSALQFTVFAVKATGERVDVTIDATATSSRTNAIASTSISSGNLRIAFGDVLGETTLKIRAGGLTWEKPVWVTGTGLAGREIKRLVVHSGDGFSPMIADDKGQYSSVPGRRLFLTFEAIHDGGSTDITNEVQLTPLDADVMSVEPGLVSAGALVRYLAYTRTPGTARLSLRWAGLSKESSFHVAPAFVLGWNHAEARALTENAGGRLTAYMIAGPDLAGRKVAVISSTGNNEWTQPILLDSPPFPPGGLLADVKAAESANGYRAVLTTNALTHVWLHLIDPDGAILGPFSLVNSDSGRMILPEVAVSADGNAHVWLLESGQITRLLVRRVDQAVSVIDTVSFPTNGTLRIPSIGFSENGRVGLGWLEGPCGLSFAFDSLDNVGALDRGEFNAIALPNCQPDLLHQSKVRIAVTGDEIVAGARYATQDTTGAAVALATMKRGALPFVQILDQESSAIARGAPQVAAYESGAFVFIWQTSERGVRGVHRTDAGVLSESFEVEPPFFTLATPDVEGVYRRGDGKFLLAWLGGESGVRDRLEFRDFSPASGLGPRRSFPYEVASATNETKLLASKFGVSAAWSYFDDLDQQIFSALQRFEP